MLNLIADSWIPVRRKDGRRTTIAPWQMADANLEFPDWPRPDLNIACLELLVGLVFLADPPRDAGDWRARQQPDPDRLRNRLAPFAPAFELIGEGPRFMQDRERLEASTQANPADMLFIDSAGGQTLRNNADLVVKRARYPRLDPALAAMALYTLQAHAPSGGKGNRTSMRGGGPLLTLLDPGQGLWPLVWANVPDGAPASTDVLPWTRPARTSEKPGSEVYPHMAHPAEAFFGLPRRLRLVADGGAIAGVVQRPYGTNYAGWEHPLTPHYRQKAGSELLPRHPRAGVFGYRNWLGIVARRGAGDDTVRRAKVVDLWGLRSRDFAEIVVAGWAMDNMKPRDFIFSRAPLIDLDPEAAAALEGMVEAADALAAALRGALAVVLAEGEAREAAREVFFLHTQAPFEQRAAQLTSVNFSVVARAWLADMRAAALAIFDAHALPGLSERDVAKQAMLIRAQRNLSAAFAGYGKSGQAAFMALGLEVPEPRKGRAA